MPACVGPSRKPHCWFSRHAAQIEFVYFLTEPAVSPVTEDVEPIIQPETAESVTSPILTKTNPVVDIYSNKQAEAPLLSQRSMESVLSPLSPDPPKGVEWGRSESQQEEYYGKLLP